MRIPTCPRASRTALAALGWATLASLAGCQSYRRSPLDLDEHREAFEARVSDTESIAAFHDRLIRHGAEVPARLDLADGLTFSEAEVVALFWSPSLRLARLRAGVALATAENAGLWADPRFGFTGAELLSPTGPFEYGATLNLTLPVSGRLAVETDRADAAHEAELRRVIDAEWNTRARLRSAWAAWTAAEERDRLLADVAAQIDRIRAITDRLEEIGELTRVEARLIRSERIEVEAARTEARLSAVRARVEVLGLLGLPPDAKVELVPALGPADVPDASDPVARLVAANTALAVRRAEYRTAEESLRLEIREQYPDVTLGGGFGSEMGDDRLLLGLSVPIPIWNANRASIAEARARRETARGEAETTFERLLRELATARAALEAARAQRRAFEEELVPMLDDQAKEIERLADLGEVDTLLLLETVTRGYEAKSRLLDVRVAEVRASVELERLLGPEGIPSPAPVAPAPREDRATRDRAASRSERTHEGGADGAAGGER